MIVLNSIIVFFVFFGLFVSVFYLYLKYIGVNNKSKSKLGSLSECELVKKFNSLGKKLLGSADRSIDKIADEMLSVLREYKCRKVEQFVEAEQMLSKNKRHITEQLETLNQQMAKLKTDAKKLKKENMSDEDYALGALYMAQLDETEKLQNDLQNTFDENNKQLEYIEKQVKQFNVKYALKEGNITNMIIKAKTHKNISNADIELNDLITEFKDKVNDIEIEMKVKSQINGDTNTEIQDQNFIVNKEDYINKFKKYINQ